MQARPSSDEIYVYFKILYRQGFPWDHKQAEDKQNLTALFQSDQKYVMCAYLLQNATFIYNYNIPMSICHWQEQLFGDNNNWL